MSKIKNWLDEPLTWRRYIKTQFVVGAISGIITTAFVGYCVATSNKFERELSDENNVEDTEINITENED